jgi:peptide deformylase
MTKIVLYPEKILRQVLPKVTEVDKKLIGEMKDLEEILKGSENGAGLAANQIGSEKRMFGLKRIKDKKITVFINPRIIGVYGQKVYPKMMLDDDKEEDFLEGCLSFPDLYGTVKRFLKIEAEWEEVVGEKLETRNRKLEGFEAIVFQHEADHLDGILFVDHIKRDGGKFYKWEDKEKIEWSVDKVIERER